MKALPAWFLLIAVFSVSCVSAQDKRTQYPKFLSNAYFNLNFGYIDYRFTRAQLEPGFQAENITTPRLAFRLVFFGYRFNKHLSAQVSYMKPPMYVAYHNINGDQSRHSVSMHYGTLTLRSQLPLSKKLDLYGEAGLGIVTRRGFMINNIPVVKNTSYGSLSAGAGFDYHINRKWNLTAGTVYAPGKSSVKQPRTFVYLAGFRYKVQPLSEELAAANAKAGYVFPKNLLQFGYSTNALGYGVNNRLSKGPIAIFWGGKVEIEKGLWLRYQRNVFHTRKVFSLDLGASTGWWKTNKNKEEFFSLSVFPVLRFTVLRTNAADLYLNYSAAGPSYISRLQLDQLATGRHFTFQDFMGMGVFAGKKRNLNAEISINHYSNGNMFPENAGVKIPLTFNLGYTF